MGANSCQGQTASVQAESHAFGIFCGQQVRVVIPSAPLNALMVCSVNDMMLTRTLMPSPCKHMTLIAS